MKRSVIIPVSTSLAALTLSAFSHTYSEPWKRMVDTKKHFVLTRLIMVFCKLIYVISNDLGTNCSFNIKIQNHNQLWAKGRERGTLFRPLRAQIHTIRFTNYKIFGTCFKSNKCYLGRYFVSIFLMVFIFHDFLVTVPFGTQEV